MPLLNRTLGAAVILVISIGLPMIACGGDDAKTRTREASVIRSYWATNDGDITLPVLTEVSGMTEQEWNGAVDKLETEGLNSLTTDQRRSVLSGAIKAYLARAREVSLHLDVSAPQGVLSAEIRETYSQDEMGLYTILQTRSLRSDGGFIDTWGGGLLLSAEGPVESQLVVETLDPYRIVFWSRERTDSPWICEVSDDGAGLAGGVLAHFGLITSVIDGSVIEVSGSEYQIETQRDPDNIQYVLDAATLWPKEITVAAANDGITDSPEGRYIFSSDGEFEAVQPPDDGC